MRATYYFDIASIVIMIVVLIYQAHHANMENTRRRIFLVVILSALAAAVISVMTVTLASAGLCGMTTILWANVIVFILKESVAPFYCVYVVATTDTFHKLKKNKLKTALCILPYGIMVLCLLINGINNFVFTVRPDGTIVKGGGYLVLFICEIAYGIISVAYIRHCRMVVGNTNTISLAAPVALVWVAVVLFLIFPEYEVFLFVVSMCFLLLLLLNKQSEGLRDSTTGFLSQVAFAQDFNGARIVNKDVRIIILTITNYRTVVDIMGHEKTENFIEAVALRIKELLRKENIMSARCYYHEEGCFTIVTPKELFGKSNGLAHEFATSVMKDIMFNSIDLELSANVCMVECPQDVDTLDGLLMLMSDLMESKHAGGVLKASEYIKQGNFELRKQMSVIIDRAIMNNYLSVYYQPIYSVKEDNFHSAEALIRLNDPEHGFISPAVFIPVAEKTGAIHKIGAYVLEEVCKFIASPEFAASGLEYIEVNLSATQCLRRNLTDEIMYLMAKYGVTPKQLNLEITETAECYSQDRLLSNIMSLYNRGFSFSLDDFGTGYSNLLRMASLPLTIIKLDRTFVCMDEDPKFHCVITNMVSLFKQMGMQIVVEGIETKEMIDNFSNLEVDYIQGFYFSKPLPKDDFVDYVRNYNLKMTPRNAGKED